MRALVLPLALLALAACLDSWDAPLSTKPQPGYPCGVTGVVCETRGMCCSEGETCGGGPDSVGCPPGQCCFMGDPDDGPPAARRRVHPQRPAQP